jgi:pyridoxine 4-dehydrogenase
MGMSDAYGPADRSESLATLHAALDAGITLFDTGDFYSSGGNELLLGEAFTGIVRNRYQLSVKFGGLRDPNGGWGPVDGRPASIKNFLAYSLKRLRVDYIDVYRPARLDPAVPIEETIGALSDCVQMGWIRYVGLSEVGAETLRRAHAVHPIEDLQIEYSLLTLEIETEILPTCRELGIGITPYGVLSRGLLSGFRLNGDQDVRAQMPRFQGDNLRSNLAIVEGLRAIASERGATATELAIAWVLSRGPDVVPLVGVRRRQSADRGDGQLETHSYER